MGEKIVSVWVGGLPIPQGQMMPRMTCRLRGNKQCKAWLCPPDKQAWKDWRETVTEAVRRELGPGHDPKKGDAYLVSLEFDLPRPKSHYTSKGVLNKRAPAFHVVRPDLDNLAKSVHDSLTRAGVWHDDSEVVGCRLEKAYVSSNPGVMIEVARVEQCFGS